MSGEMGMPSNLLRTYVYVDGFNLYYCALKGTRYKWLNLKAAFEAVLSPTYDIQKIKYYTADVSGRHDPGAPKRQKALLDALKTIPEVEIFKGKFLVTQKWAGLANPPTDFVKPSPATARIIRTEEKGSDVNLASHVIRDAFQKVFDVAVVVSNDTDLVEPIRIVTQELGVPVGIICPKRDGSPPSQPLAQVASFIRHLRVKHLRSSQFPLRIPGTNIQKPPSW